MNKPLFLLITLLLFFRPSSVAQTSNDPIPRYTCLITLINDKGSSQHSTDAATLQVVMDSATAAINLYNFWHPKTQTSAVKSLVSVNHANATAKMFARQQHINSLMINGPKQKTLKLDKMAKTDISLRIKNAQVTNANIFKQMAVSQANIVIGTTTPGNVNSLNATTVTNLGGLDVTNLALGLAEFTVNRAKSDLTVSFFNKLNREMNKYPEIATLLPSTLTLLKNDLVTLHFNQFLPQLRQAFFNDLSSLPGDMANVLSLPRYQPLMTKFPEIRVAVESLGIIPDFRDANYHPAEVIELLADIPDYNDSLATLFLQDYGASWKLLSVLSDALLNADSMRYYNPKELQAFFKIPGNDTLFVRGLIGELRIKHVMFFSAPAGKVFELDTAPVLMQAVNHMQAITSFFTQASQGLQQVDAAIKDFNAAKDAGEITGNITALNTQKKNAATAYLNATVNSINSLLGFASMVDYQLGTQPYMDMVRNLTAIESNAVNQDYGSLVNHSLNFITDVLQMCTKQTALQDLIVKNGGVIPNVMNAAQELKSEGLNNSITTREQARKAASAMRDTFSVYAQKANAVLGGSAFDSIGAGLKIITDVVKFGNFAASLVDAKTPADVQNALENAVLPAGSTAIKKNSAWNVSLQIYLGGAFAYPLNNANASLSWKQNFLVTLPVGLSFNRGFGNKGGSLGMFLSVFDVGAVAQYAIQNSGSDSATLKEKIQLQDIVSPSFQLTYGFGANIPLAINAGVQYGPGLTRVTQQNLTTGTPTWRLLFSLVYDLPAYTIFNSTGLKTVKAPQFTF